MRHYEIIVLMHPSYEDQIQSMINGYKSFIEEANGKVHRFENWGKISLAHTIKKQRKAHYFLLNVECNQDAVMELERKMHFNDAVLRYLFIRMKKAYTEQSVFLTAQQNAKSSSISNASNTNPMYSKASSQKVNDTTVVEGEQNNSSEIENEKEVKEIKESKENKED